MKKFLTIASLAILAACGGENSETLGGLDNDIIFPIFSEETANVNLITADGVVESLTTRTVTATLGLTIDEVHVRVGDVVREGEILARLSSEDLELTIAQHRAALQQGRAVGAASVADIQTMLNEAAANLANGTNVHILTAEANLLAATAAVADLQLTYENAVLDLANVVLDFEQGTSPHILESENLLRTVDLSLTALERDHENLVNLFSAGIATQHEVRLSEDALEQLRSQQSAAQQAHAALLESIERALESQQRAINQLHAGISSAQAAEQNAREILTATRTAAEQEISILRSNLATAQAAADLDHMEVAIQQLERTLQDTVITAPINGTITAVIAEEGGVGMGPLFVLADTESLRIRTFFREYDLPQLAVGTEVRITADGATEEYFGEISLINPSATQIMNISVYEAEIAITSPQPSLYLGMTTRITIQPNTGG